MSTFASLLKYSEGKPPREAQERARLGFPTRVLHSKLILRNPAMPLDGPGKRLVIGIASYSPQELKLLDLLETALKNGKEGPAAVEVFDTLACRQMSDFDAFIPGMDRVYETPVLGVFCDGKLIDRATGLSQVIDALRRFNVLSQGL